ncbi:hypothetical protein TNCT_315431 [Trichonephila clavata]|uniref:Uncharacterized protein n=1 Tax=Trichonephila clavata TaxID=2740835 RepID=A0A8X6F391_TRICU|nr:hypothetical protein TNCT_315431 [Trichonephila clavata]
MFYAVTISVTNLDSGKRYYPKNIGQIDRLGDIGILIWGRITLHPRTQFHIFYAGTVTAELLIDVILETCKLLFRKAVGDQFIFFRR